MNIFIDTEDMEERHTEQLYQEYLEKENKELHNKIDKAVEIIESCNLGIFDYSIEQIGIIKLLKILKESDIK